MAALLLLVLVLPFLVAPLRRRLVSRPLMKRLAGVLPRISDTEREALEAGTVWLDGELFSGAPRWRQLLALSLPSLTSREEAFLKGPVEELCRLTDPWETTRRGDLSSEVWQFLKDQGFFGMIIPRDYGGLGLSALAHSAVVSRLGSRSVALAVTVMVPNSLGPAELLLHYGTEEQKSHYLPRLASGEEIPCFALTEPEAGSDAAGLKSEGVICRGCYRGRHQLGMRLNWNKRYTTLGPVATVIGRAFRLKDPDHLLGEKEDLGMTCALIPADLPGIEIGRRHDPLGIPFYNGPTRGRDVFVPLQAIIGGVAMAGQGWRMLMQSLAAGRSISLPSLASGAAQLCVRVSGAYASIREQFGLPIGRFEGIQEPLARMGGHAYLMNAARRLTAAAVDQGERPSVLSAAVKCSLTELMRDVVNDAMDIAGGAGIVRGPRNCLAEVYTAIPIGITVEGANILTRSLIIFGQGILRCHPFAREGIDALVDRDLRRFDRALLRHLGFVLGNAARSWAQGLTGGRLSRRPTTGEVGRLFQHLGRMSAAFALLADAALLILGGDLKRREKLSGRLADALTWLYLASATLKKFIDDGRPVRDRAAMKWAVMDALHRIQTALAGFLDNLPTRGTARVLDLLVFPLGRTFRPPDDGLGGTVARELLDGRDLYHALTGEIYLPRNDERGLGGMETALRQVVPARPLERRLRQAVEQGRLEARPAGDLLDRAVATGWLTPHEAGLVHAARKARLESICVDSMEPRLTACRQP
ncbi:MAG: acyl-CoA dehydrogenase [Acidobacteriota bacterium]